MNGISFKRRVTKRVFVFATILAWGLIIAMIIFLEAITSPEDSAQGALIVLAFLPVIEFVFLIWVVVAVGSAIMMFVTRSRNKPIS